MSCYQPTGGNQPSLRTPLAPPPSGSPPSAGPSNTGVIMIAGQKTALRPDRCRGYAGSTRMGVHGLTAPQNWKI
jgi:hypothetical protein